MSASAHSRLAPRPAALALGAALAVVVLVALAAAYPATAILAVALGAIAFLAITAPLAALFLALLLFECEGAVKIALTAGGHPGPGGADAFSAGALDLGLAVAVGGLLWRDRLQSPLGVWRAAKPVERVALLLIPVWLLASVLQVMQNDSLARGLDGFRLTQSYALMAVAGIVVVSRFPRRKIIGGLLAVASILAAYAALRTLTGPLPAERAYVLSRTSEAFYGSTFRSIGSLSGSVGLASLMTPIFVLTAVLGMASKRWRAVAWACAACALFAAIFTYTRISLVACAVALAAVAILGLSVRRPSRRPTIVAVAATACLAAAAAGAIVVAASASPQTEERLRGFVHPGSDTSLQMRFDTWGRAVSSFADRPLGRGVGAVGNAARIQDETAVTTDNSFLKVLVEQGIVGTPIFVLGIIGVCTATALRLRRAPPADLGLGLAAFGAFLSFVSLWAAGEYIEQPGKVLAWLLLGVSIGVAFRVGPPPETSRRITGKVGQPLDD